LPEFGSGDFAPDRAQPALDRGEILRGQHADRGQHARMRERSRDVGVGQSLIEIDRCGVLLDDLGDRLAESAGPAADRIVAGI